MWDIKQKAERSSVVTTPTVWRFEDKENLENYDRKNITSQKVNKKKTCEGKEFHRYFLNVMMASVHSYLNLHTERHLAILTVV